MRKRRIKNSLILLSPLILLTLFSVVENLRGHYQLAKSKHALTSQGEKLEVKELTPSFSASSRSNASELLGLTSGLSNSPALPNMMRLVAPGKARVLWKQAELRDYLVTNSWESLDAQTATVVSGLSDIGKLLENSSFDFGFNYGPYHYRENASYLSKVKGLALWTQAAALNNLHQGNRISALHQIEQILAQADSLKEERLIISQLVRISMTRIALSATWEALQASDWTDSELAQMQTAWGRMHFAGEMALAFDMERTLNLAMLDKLRDGNQEISQALFAPSECGIGNPGFKPPSSAGKFFAVRIVGAMWRFTWGSQAENHYLISSQKFVSATRKAAETKSVAEFAPAVTEFEHWYASAGIYSQARFFLTKLLLPAWPTAERKALSVETEKWLVLTAIALKRYAMRYGKPTSELSALTPEFLATIPTDYMNGKPLNYRLNSDGTWLLYSVGEDEKDDGGDSTPEGTFSSYRGIWNGKDAVWPIPASKQEVEEYDRKKVEEQKKMSGTTGNIL